MACSSSLLTRVPPMPRNPPSLEASATLRLSAISAAPNDCASVGLLAFTTAAVVFKWARNELRGAFGSNSLSLASATMSAPPNATSTSEVGNASLVIDFNASAPAATSLVSPDTPDGDADTTYVMTASGDS